MIRQTYSRNLATVMLLQTSIFGKIRNITKMSYFKQNVNPSKRVQMDGVFLGLAGLLPGISLGLCRREILRSSPASLWKTQSIPPLLLGLTRYFRRQLERTAIRHFVHLSYASFASSVSSVSSSSSASSASFASSVSFASSWNSQNLQN